MNFVLQSTSKYLLYLKIEIEPRLRGEKGDGEEEERRRGGEEESKAYACLPIQASLSSLDMAYPSGTRLGRQVLSRPPLGYAMSISAVVICLKGELV